MWIFRPKGARDIEFWVIFQTERFFVYTHDFPGQFFFSCQGEQWVNFVRENWLHKLQNSQCWNTWHLEKRHHQFWTTTAPYVFCFNSPLIYASILLPLPPHWLGISPFFAWTYRILFLLIICYCARRTSFLMRWAFS